MKVNVGCGRFPANGWINIDADPGVIADRVIDITQNLPPDITGITAVYLGHILHLIPPADVPVALHQIWQRCQPGAQVAIVGPDALRLLDKGLDMAKIYQHLGGDQRAWACDARRLLDIVRMSGLQRARPVDIDSEHLQGFPVVSRVTWQCAVRGQVR
jgi:predicted SAM-dependent methyltransferase